MRSKAPGGVAAARFFPYAAGPPASGAGPNFLVRPAGCPVSRRLRAGWERRLFQALRNDWVRALRPVLDLYVARL